MKSNIINKKLSFFIVCVLLHSLSCAMPWQTKAVVTYESMGETLISTKPALKSLCASGEMSAEDCIKAKDTYNLAVTAYKELGDLFVIALDTGDSSDYKSKELELIKLLEAINIFISGGS